MGYSNENDSKSLSLAMVASVGFHAILVASMAFFPASSETVKKPLRIVNLLPPEDVPLDPNAPPTVNTATLEDILKNPLPDLSAGIPPLGSADAPLPSSDPDASTYLGTNRPNLSGLKTANPPVRSFTPSKPSQPPKASSKPPGSSTSRQSNPKSRSGITKAPSTPQNLPSPPSFPTRPPSVVGAVPEPDATGALQEIFPNNLPGGAPKIPPSRQTLPTVISRSVPYDYPKDACDQALEGTVELTYSRQPDGSLIAPTVEFSISSDSQLLNDAAYNAVSNYPEFGTGSLQKYLTRIDFVHPNPVCTASAPASSTPSQSQPAPSETSPSDDQTVPKPVPKSEKTSKPSVSDDSSSDTKVNSESSPDKKPEAKEKGTIQPTPPSKSSESQDESAPVESTPQVPKVKPGSSLPSQPQTPPASVPSDGEGSASDLAPIEPAAPAPKPVIPTPQPAEQELLKPAAPELPQPPASELPKPAAPEPIVSPPEPAAEPAPDLETQSPK